MSFIAAALLLWWPALEPKRRRVPGELWKVPYVLGARFASMFLGMSLIVIRVPVYTGAYPAGQRAHGLSAVADQQAAGGIMISVDIAIMVLALCFFFLRAGGDAEREDRREAALLTSR
jgi:putative copper resistance protein D